MLGRLAVVALVALGLSLVADSSAAAISLNNAVVDFRPGDRPVKDVVVRNHGDKTAYIEVTLTRILKPGEQPEEAVDVDRKDTQLIIAPRKLVIPAGGRKTLRIISRHQALEKDAIYRAVVKPVGNDAGQTGKLGVKVVVAYGLLIMVRPQSLVRRLRAERAGKVITFFNDGNTNLELREGQQCVVNAKGEETCQSVSGSRLYAGGSQRVELPLDVPVQFHYRVAGELFSEVFN